MLESDAPFDMANLFPKHTGLPFVVWISTRGGAQHDVRVKVSGNAKAVPGQMASVAIRPSVHLTDGILPPRELELLTRWIEANREPLIQYWEGDIDTVDVLAALRPIA